MQCVVHFVWRKLVFGKKEMMQLRNTNYGVHLVSSLEVYLSGTFLLVIPNSLPDRLSSKHEAATCVVLVTTIEPIHIEKVVNILVCISYFASVQF